MTPEQRLAEYWRKKTGLDWSDFDAMDPVKRLKNPIWQRDPPLEAKKVDEMTWDQITSYVAMQIMRGFPLTFEEYHIAIANRLLLTELPYEKFYKTRWYENKDKRGYGKG